MKNIKLILITMILVLASFTIGTRASNNQQVANQLKVECTYPYGKDGFLTNNCYALINMALRNGFKVSHDTVRPDGSVTFTIK